MGRVRMPLRTVALFLTLCGALTFNASQAAAVEATCDCGTEGQCDYNFVCCFTNGDCMPNRRQCNAIWYEDQYICITGLIPCSYNGPSCGDIDT